MCCKCFAPVATTVHRDVVGVEAHDIVFDTSKSPGLLQVQVCKASKASGLSFDKVRAGLAAAVRYDISV